MPTPGYDYQSWMLAEVQALERAFAHGTSTTEAVSVAPRAPTSTPTVLALDGVIGRVSAGREILGDVSFAIGRASSPA